jgi:hypothetical protein
MMDAAGAFGAVTAATADSRAIDDGRDQVAHMPIEDGRRYAVEALHRLAQAAR